MPYLNSSSELDSPELGSPDRYDRLRRTATLAGDALPRWRRASLAIFGAGNLGSRLAPEAVRSGASVVIVDPDMGRTENLGTQAVRVGLLKAAAVQAACDEIQPARALAWPIDARHVGVGQLAGVDLLIDVTDDPGLALPLTVISNGLAIPLLRIAVDGSGQREFGRVAVSHGGAGHACACCSYSLQDIAGPRRRHPCPGDASPRRPPTLAGGAISLAIAGIGLLQAMRLVTGAGAELALDRELLLDLSSQQMLSVRLPRCEQCLTGHLRWSPSFLGQSAHDLTLVDLFQIAGRELGGAAETLEPYLHPLWTAAVCACGGRLSVVGGPWSPPPACATCGAGMEWMPGSQRARWTLAQARESGLDARSLADCGLPKCGAMFVGRSAGRPPARLVLA